MPRLDLYLYENGSAASRSLAAKLVKGGYVFIDGKECRKSSAQVEEGMEVSLQESPLTRYVSRGGLKLEEALKTWGIDPTGMICADIGASTGGFTDCLLQHGAKKVFAIDSGTDQLHPALKENENVVSMENVNARFLNEGMIGKVDLVVMDVSFISQTLLYPAVLNVLKEDGIFISLVKPQFEVGREYIASGGIVRNEKAREACLEKIRAQGEHFGLTLREIISSPIAGGDGNREYLALFFRSERKETL